MTAIRTIVFFLLCSFTTSGAFADVVNVGMKASDNFLKIISSNWQCEAKGETVTVVLTDSFHDGLLVSRAHAENTRFDVNLERSGETESPLITVAKGVWQSLWSNEQVVYEVISETAFRLISQPSTSKPNQIDEMVCTKSDTIDL